MRALTAALAVGLAMAIASPAAAQAPACDPFTEPSFRGEVPVAQDVIGIGLGDRDVTTQESDDYLLAVDRSSPRVVSGVAATSNQGRALRYAVVGKPGNVTARGLESVRASAAKLMDPRTSASEAASIARANPAILWIAGNVHGGEESGTDAALRTLYELADRDDCAARRILDESIVVILPTQNPDGREADTRQNAYGFDMNRDWFARTQPETDGKVELLRRFPGVMFIDAHEMGNTGGFFFPPNADPIYHEITEQSVRWINTVYGASMQAEFRERGIPFFNYNIYDLFYMGYGDTVPSTGFGSAGMTYEKTSSHPTPRRVFEQYLTQWTSLSAAAINKREILSDWHAGWVEAERQGRAGELEPNEVVQPENTVQSPVPDKTVRHYFVRADDPSKARETQAMIRRLQRMDVEVRRLSAPLQVPDYTPYGRESRAETLPAGTYWIPLAQRQKHWVQAMLNEDTYTPFPYFYDVTGWSQPLLFNIAGGYSGANLQPSGGQAPALPAPAQQPIPAGAPRVAVFQVGTGTAALESTGWLRYLLDSWGLPFRLVTAADIRGGALSDVDVLLAPDGSTTGAYNGLQATGRQALTDWVTGGGRLVGWAAGTALAARLGLTQAQLAAPTSDVPGSLFRVRVDGDSPLAEGVGPFAWAFYEYDNVMTHPDPSAVVLRFPPADSQDFFVSGFADGEEELGGTAALVDEPAGDGRAVLFSVEPNFRAFTDGTQKVLRNAILGPDPAAAPAARAAARGVRVRRSVAAAGALRDAPSALRLTVRRRGEAKARRALRRLGASYTVTRSRGRVRFVIANPGELTGEDHPYAKQLGAALRRAKAPVVAFRAP